MHDKNKQILLNEANGSPANQALIDEISVPGFEFLPKIETQRFIKSHLPLCLLPPSIFKENAKVGTIQMLSVLNHLEDSILDYLCCQKSDGRGRILLSSEQTVENTRLPR
jgi:hypothetical protein